jgi:hypothetical protein
MQERQVTAGAHTFDLPDPFFVLATQNPIEQEGRTRFRGAARSVHVHGHGRLSGADEELEC